MSRQERAAKNVLVSVGTQLLAWAMTFAVTLYLPRYLGDDGLGKFALAASFVAVFDVFIPLGTTTVLIKEVALERTRAGELLASALLLRIPLAILLTGLASLLAFFLGYEALTQQLIFVSAVAMIFSNTNDALSAILVGQENMSRQSIAVLVEKFLSSAAILTLISLKASLPAIAAVGIFTGVVAVGVNLVALRPLLPAVLRRLPTRQTMQNLAVAGLPFMGWTVFRTLYGRTDPIVMRFVTTESALGWYDLPTRLIGATLFFPAAVTAALLPTLTALHAEGAREFGDLSRRLFAILTLLGVPVAVLFCCLPQQIISLMRYPVDFAGSIPVLRVGGISALLYFLAMAVGTILIASDRQIKMFRTSVAATFLGVPLCYAGSLFSLKTFGNAAIGAMASDVILEVFLIACYLRVLPRGTLGRESVSLFLRVLLAAVPMVLLCLHPIGQKAGLLILLPASLLYLMSLVLLRCVDRNEYLFLVRRLLRRGETV